MSSITWILIAVGIISVLIYRSGVLSGKTLSLPKFGTLPTTGTGTFSKIALMIFLIVLLAFVWIWWPETVLGSKIQTLISTHIGQEWVPYGMQYFPTAIILWFMWKTIFGAPVAGKTIFNGLVALAAIIAICVTIFITFGSKDNLGTTKEVEGPRLRQAGDTETMKVRTVDTIRIYTPTHKVSDGKTVYRTCLKVSKPASLQSNADAGTEFHFVMHDPHAKNNYNKAKLSPGIKKFLERDSWTEVEVEFTLVETVAGVNPCRFTAWTGPVKLPLGRP